MAVRRIETVPGIDDNPLWYKDAVIYQLHVRAFHDSNGDGIGDFPGLTEKLDYLQDLGVTALWLLPFYPSPLKDDGYDIADYTNVHPDYGTVRDFQTFLREAHRRGLRVITELVLNHTSDTHAWFERARRAAPGSRYRDYYVWSDTPERYSEARIIFKDFEHSNWTWDNIAHAYQWHRFYSHQPDLNFDSTQVRREMLRVVDFWMGMGVDGLRLDAVPYLFEREGTNCENLPETHAFLQELRAHIDRRFKNRMLLAEANQWPEDARAYFGAGNECHMAFHFPLMPRMFMGIHQEDRFPIIDILEHTPEIPENAQWAVFLRNHDELTLEMVTDEERDYMYRVYASDPQARINLGIRRRLAPLLGNNRRNIELLNGLLFALPGTPVLYYGDEIGMGDNIYLGDRNGVRTPMQWSPDRNAGFSRANPQRLFQPVIIDPEYHYESINVEAQQNNQHSMLWWMKRLIALRKRHQAFGRGTLELLAPENRRVLAFIRRYEDENILVVANLSRFVQAVELDLSEFNGRRPVELFGRIEFPAIGELPYFLTLGPHSFYWFSIESQPSPEAVSATPEPRQPIIDVAGDPAQVFEQKSRRGVEAVLPGYLRTRRWFGAKGRRIRTVDVTEVVRLRAGRSGPLMLFVRTTFDEGEPQTYMLPVALAEGDEAEEMLRDHVQLVVARVRRRGDDEPQAVLYDAVGDKSFGDLLLSAVSRRRRIRGEYGEAVSSPTRALRSLRAALPEDVEPVILRAEQSNTSVVYGDRLIMKLFRRLDEGTNPDLEIGRFLTEKARFEHTPSVAGSIEYERGRAKPITLAILQEFVPNQGDAWRYTLDSLALFYERALTEHAGVGAEELVLRQTPLELAQEEISARAYELVGPYLASAELLGRRTAQLHLALAMDSDNPDFAPEPFGTLYQRSLHQSWRTSALQTFQFLRRRVSRLPEEAQPEARELLSKESDAQERFRSVLDHRIRATRTRTHGDYHLGQVLFTGRDFVIIDFEGEPARPLSERRIKRSPLRDVAGMLRSFHYAAYTALSGEASGSAVRHEDVELLEPWARFWYVWTSAAFLRAYLDEAQGATFVPQDMDHVGVLLDGFLLEKALYEISYEMNNRPEWVRIPLRGALELLTPAPEEAPAT